MSKESELLEALRTGNETDFNRLINEVNLSDCIDEEGQTAAHLAAMYGNVFFLRELIARGVSAITEDHDGETPLQSMINHILDERILFTHRHAETMTLLFANGASLTEIEALREEGEDNSTLDFIIAQATNILIIPSAVTSEDTSATMTPADGASFAASALAELDADAGGGVMGAMFGCSASGFLSLS